MYPASDAAFYMPRACMGVRRSSPIHNRVLWALCCNLVFPISSHRPLRHILRLTLLHLRQPPDRCRLPCRALSLIGSALGHKCPNDTSHLVGKSKSDQHGWFTFEHTRQPRSCSGSLSGRPPYNRTRPDNKQSAQRSLPHLRSLAEPLLPARGMLQRCEPEPRGKIPPAFERLGCRS